MVTSWGQLSHMGLLLITLSGPNFIRHTNPASLEPWLPAMQFQVLMGRGHKQVNGTVHGVSRQGL